MITIQPLTTFRPDDLETVMPGYTSTEKYAITRHESGDQISFQLRLVPLTAPYVKVWDFRDPVMIDQYENCIKTGLSLGAFDGPQMVGIAICEAQVWNRSLAIWEFGVTASHRQRGIGRDLINAVAACARQQNLRVLVAETQNTNVPAIRFYRSVGFELDGLDLSYYSNEDMESGEVALFMKRKV
jgi:ribosomal protein S18 acetylase RimI-like enzyme